jgi:nitrate/nitrite transport system substrate-binding protein
MTPLSIGFVPLTDCAVLAVAHEKRFFRRHGIAATLVGQVSWANVRDKLAAGALDAAQVLAAMPLAAALRIDPVATPTVAALCLGLSGNAITVSQALWRRMRDSDPEATAAHPFSARALRRVIDHDRSAGRPALRFATVYPFSTHGYELRYWLAAGGIDPDRDVRLSVVPPPRMAGCLERREIDGYCVGEPWNTLAVHRGIGVIVATKYDIWNNAPEKLFAVRRDWADRHPEVHRAALRALIEAAAWADVPGHREELAHLLSTRDYVAAPARLLAASLTGRMTWMRGEAILERPDFHVFHRYAATFPWLSHAAWIASQMQRWGEVGCDVEPLAVARAVLRPEAYREAARDLGAAAPAIDVKREGVHAGPWTLEEATSPIAMGPDLFLDRAVFDAGALPRDRATPPAPASPDASSHR